MVTWIVEGPVFSEEYGRFTRAVEAAGHRLIPWNDDWWSSSSPPDVSSTVIFHGSLGHADRIRRELSWVPGAFCDTEAFHCSRWYAGARRWLLHEDWTLSTVGALTADPAGIAGAVATEDSVFVRPDSPLKPFAGRVCQLDGLTPSHLDHGYYYDDLDLPVVIAPIRRIEREWRFVVVEGHVVAWSGYEADGRSATGAGPTVPVAEAESIAQELEAPEVVYVMDLCRCDGSISLLELNPFSGADLYGCRPEPIISEVSRVAAELASSWHEE